MAELSEDIKLGADASGVEAGVGRAKRSLADLGSTAERTGKTGGAGLEKLSLGGDKAARSVERSTKSMQGQIQRLIASFEGGEKGSRQFYESLAKQRGVDVNSLKPLLDQLDAVKAKSEAAAGASSRVSGSLGTMGESARSAARFLGALGLAVSVGGLVAWSRSALNAADETAKLAQKVGLVTEEVAGLQLAFRQAGAGDQMQAALARLSKEAAIGNKAFEAIGVSAKGADGQLKSTRDLLGEVADKFSTYRDGAEKTALAQQLFGKAGADLIPLLNAGSGALDEYDAVAKRLGLTLDTETAQAAERFNDSIDLLGQRTQGIARQIATGLLPVLEQLSSAMSKSAQQGRNFESVGEGVSVVLETIAVIAVNTNYVLKQTGDTLGGLVAAYQAFFTGNFKGAREIGRQMRENGETSRREVDATTRAILNARKIAASVKGAEEYDEPRFRRALRGFQPDKVAAPIVPTGRTAASGAGSSASRAISAANKELENQGRLLADLAGLSGSFAKDWDLLTNAFNAGRLSLEGLTEAQGQLLAKQPFAVALAKEEAEAVKQLAAAREADAKAYADAMETRQSAAATIADQITKERESIQMMGLTRVELAELEAAKLEDAAASQMRLGAIADEIDWSGKMGDAYRAEAAQLRTLADLKRSSAARQTTMEAAEDAAKAWEKTAGKIEDTLTDALMRGFESGESFGENLADSIVNTFKTYVAREIASAISRAIVSAIAGQQWGQLLSGVMGGGGGGGGVNWLDIASKGYNYFSGGATAASAYSLAGAGSTGLGLTATSGTGAALASGSTGLGLTAGGGTGLTAAAYTSTATTAGAAAGASTGAAAAGAAAGSAGATSALAAIPVWGWIAIAAIALWEPMFGRKTKAIGQAGNFDGAGGIATSQYTFQQGGLFRGDKTTYEPLNDGDAFQRQLKGVQDGMIETARVMGLGEDAIRNFAGSININLKGLDAEEAAARTKEEMTKLQAQMLATASFTPQLVQSFEQIEQAGIEMGMSLEEAAAYAREVTSRDDAMKRQGFEAMTNYYIGLINETEAAMVRAGITSAALADVITAGMTGRLDQSQVGAQLADIVLGGIYNTIAGGFAQQISDIFLQQIIQPIMLAVTAGVPLTTAISQQAMTAVVAQAQQSAQILSAIFADPVFQQTMAQLQTVISGISIASVQPARQIKAFGTAALRAGGSFNSARQSWVSLTDTIIDEIKRLRGEVLGDTPDGLAYAQSRFAITTAQARSGNRDAAAELPSLSRDVEELLRLTTTSASDFVIGQAELMASLMQTAQILAKKYKFKIPAFADGGSHAGGWAMVGERGPELAYMPPAKIYNASDTRQMMGGNDELVSEVRGLRAEVRAVVMHTAKSAKSLDRAMAPEGDAFQMREALV